MLTQQSVPAKRSTVRSKTAALDFGDKFSGSARWSTRDSSSSTAARRQYGNPVAGHGVGPGMGTHGGVGTGAAAGGHYQPMRDEHQTGRGILHRSGSSSSSSSEDDGMGGRRKKGIKEKIRRSSLVATVTSSTTLAPTATDSRVLAWPAPAEPTGSRVTLG
ncbi:hypothetical protein ZWY2020_057756 [Hordeum vulgare]|nr:hypothetical protein ZWY2020_057756 [Hordeum vulgare]